MGGQEIRLTVILLLLLLLLLFLLLVGLTVLLLHSLGPSHTLSLPLSVEASLSLSLSLTHTHTHTHTLTHLIASGAMGRYTRVVEMGTDREAHTQVQSQGEEAGGVGAYQVRQTYRIVELDPVILLFSPPLLFHSPLNLSICLSVLLYFVRDCCPRDCTKSVKFLPMDLSFSSVGRQGILSNSQVIVISYFCTLKWPLGAVFITQYFSKVL